MRPVWVAVQVLVPVAQERELVRRSPATPRRELAVAVLLVAAAVLFAAFVAAYALGASTQVLGVTLGGGLALVAAALITAGKAVVLQLVLDEPRPQAGELLARGPARLGKDRVRSGRHPHVAVRAPCPLRCDLQRHARPGGRRD